jgi:hypothetical protein
MMNTEDNLFRPARSKAETKADITDSTARAITEAEAESRNAFTIREMDKANLGNHSAVPERASTALA